MMLTKVPETNGKINQKKDKVFLSKQLPVIREVKSHLCYEKLFYYAW